jgi:hypothetical protein
MVTVIFIGMEDMIKKLLRESLLKEAMSDVMYHFTYAHKAINILKSNTLNLTSVHGSKADRDANHGRFYYLSLSTTRSAKDGYGKTITNSGVRLTLNGRALVNNKHVTNKRVDYWNTTKDPSKGQIKDEMEERIISNVDSIGPANKYITMIEVINGEPNELWRLKELADGLNIPIYAYDNLDYYSSSIKNKAIPIHKPEGELKDEDDARHGDMRDLTALMIHGDIELRRRIRYDLIKLGMDEVMVDKWLDYNQDRVTEFLRRHDSFGDLRNTISSDLHNNKSNPDKFTRYIIYKFGEELRKYGLADLGEYIQHKIYLGKKTDKMFKIEFLHGLHSALNKSYTEELEKMSGRSYQLNGTYEDDLSSFEPGVKILRKSKELLGQKIDAVINNHDGDMGNDLIRILMGLERNVLEELTDCREDAEQFKYLESLIGEDADDFHYALQSMISAIRWKASDLYDAIKEEREKQWQ